MNTHDVKVLMKNYILTIVKPLINLLFFFFFLGITEKLQHYTICKAYSPQASSSVWQWGLSSEAVELCGSYVIS